MRLRNLTLSIMAAVLCFGIVGPLNAQGVPDHSRRQMEKIKREMKAQDVPIYFLGRVIDQHGKPVEGAVVTVGITQYSGIPSQLFMKVKTLKVKTDWDGRFEIKGEKGRSLSVDKVTKEGYEFIETRTLQQNYNYGTGSTGFYVPDKNNPVIFRLRKRGEGTILFGGSGACGSGTGGSKGVGLYNLLNGHGESPKRAKYLDRIDLVLTVFKKDDNYVAVFRPIGADAGIAVSDKKLYEAPEKGYQKEYRLFIKKGVSKDHVKYLYVRSGTPALYSRFNIDVNSVYDECSVYFQYVLNPYGNRNLEKLDRSAHIYKGPLYDKARDFLKVGRLPPTPDIKAMLKNRNKVYGLLLRICA